MVKQPMGVERRQSGLRHGNLAPAKPREWRSAIVDGVDVQTEFRAMGRIVARKRPERKSGGPNALRWRFGPGLGRLTPQAADRRRSYPPKEGGGG